VGWGCKGPEGAPRPSPPPPEIRMTSKLGRHDSCHFWLSTFHIQFRVALQKFGGGGSRPAGLEGDGECTNICMVVNAKLKFISQIKVALLRQITFKKTVYFVCIKQDLCLLQPKQNMRHVDNNRHLFALRHILLAKTCLAEL
jgi:hypothetical protein